MRRCQRILNQIYDLRLRERGLTVAQLNLLVAIGAHGPLRSQDLAKALELSPSTLSRDLQRMRTQGWLVSGPQLSLTPEGDALLLDCRAGWQEAQRDAAQMLLEALPPLHGLARSLSLG